LRAHRRDRRDEDEREERDLLEEELRETDRSPPEGSEVEEQEHDGQVTSIGFASRPSARQRRARP